MLCIFAVFDIIENRHCQLRITNTIHITSGNREIPHTVNAKKKYPQTLRCMLTKYIFEFM